MSEVLSQDEIDQLLDAIADGEVNKDYEPIPYTRKIKIYDFKRPDVLSRESIKFLKAVMEENIYKLKALWQKIIPNIKSLQISSVDQLTFEEFIRSIPSPTYVLLAMSGKFPIALELDPGHLEFFREDLIADFDKKLRNGVVEKDKEITIYKKPMVNIKIPKQGEEFSDIVDEEDLAKAKSINSEAIKNLKKKKQKQRDWVKDFAKNVSKPMLVSLLKIWQKALSKQIQISPVGYKIETKPYNITYHYEEAFKSKDDEMYFLSDAMTLLFTLEVIYTDNSTGMICIDIPWKFAKQMIDMYNGNFDENKQPSTFSTDFLKDIKVPIEVSLGSTTKSISEIMNFGEGTILELNKFALDPVDIKINNKKIAEGEVIVIDDNFGVRITNCLTK